MFASGSLLAQTRPSSTTAATAFTATKHTEVTRISVCNSSTATTFGLYHHDTGTTYTQATALFYDAPIAANTTVFIDVEGNGGGIAVSPSGTIGVKTGAANNITFSIYGVTQ